MGFTLAAEPWEKTAHQHTVAPTSASKEDITRLDSSQQPLLQEPLDAATGPGAPREICLYTPQHRERLRVLLE